jgi:hypothetical protein
LAGFEAELLEAQRKLTDATAAFEAARKKVGGWVGVGGCKQLLSLVMFHMTMGMFHMLHSRCR